MRTPVLHFLAVVSLGFAADVHAQAPSDPDSADLRSDARNAQARFERVRVRHLPREMVGSGRCDEIIGRICMRHGGDDDYEPPPEHEKIVEARASLLDELRAAAARIPGDGWVRGQLVWYGLEAGESQEALRHARECRADPWWCAALEGLALHHLERFEEAEAAFMRAKAGLPDKERERWAESIKDVTDRDRWRWVESQADSAAAIDRFWALADPFFIAPGNDRRTAHLARLTVSRIRDRARNPYGMSWGFDLDELLVRYGWEAAWGRDHYRPGRMEDRVVGHHPPKSREFIPPEEVLTEPSAIGPRTWELEKDRPHSAYAPTYAPDVSPSWSQFAAFRRPAGLLLIAAADSLELEGERGLGLLDLTTGALDVGGTGDTATIHVRSVPFGSYLASEEWIAETGERGRRTRVGVTMEEVPPDVPTLSDVLLVRSTGELPVDLEQAVPQAHPGRILAAGQSVVLAWELYRMGRRDVEASYRVLLEPEDRGFLRRAGEWARLLDRDRPVVLAWTDVDEASDAPHFAAVELGLPEIEPGRYTLILEVELPGRATLTSSLTIQIAPPS